MTYRPGDWKAQCYQCGRTRLASTMKQHWQGYWVCSEHWEARHPQDFVKARADVQIPPWTQPRPRGIAIAFCTPNGTTAIAGFAVAGCARAGFISPLFDPTIENIGELV
jgi:hypothetical protein